jgi:hypothetical protein
MVYGGEPFGELRNRQVLVERPELHLSDSGQAT